MFADLNKYAIAPVLHWHRCTIIVTLVQTWAVSGNVSRTIYRDDGAGKIGISQRSNKLFTLSSIKQATRDCWVKIPNRAILTNVFS